MNAFVFVQQMHYILVVILASGGGSSGSTSTLVSVLAGILVSFLSALLVYFSRQWWEKKKLQRALWTEVEEMHGIETAANQMERIGSPPSRQLTPDDVPDEQSIPTTVYKTNASRLGLLSGFRGSSELKGAVRFYSKVMRHRSIIQRISRQNLGDDSEQSEMSVSDSDQEYLYNNIGDLNDVRKQIYEQQTFDVEYPDSLK